MHDISVPVSHNLAWDIFIDRFEPVHFPVANSKHKDSWKKKTAGWKGVSSQTAHWTVTYREYYTRCSINTIWPPDDSTELLETCRGL